MTKHGPGVCRGSWVVLSVFLLSAFAGPVTAGHDGPHGEGPLDRTFNIGKKGDVKIGEDVKIGDVLVRKGKYLISHRVEGDHHIVVLTGVDKTPSSESSIHEIRMRFFPSRDRVKKSALFAEPRRDRSYEVTVIQIAGEDGDHAI